MASLVCAKALTRSLLHHCIEAPKPYPLSQLLNLSRGDHHLLSSVRTLTSKCLTPNFPNWQYQSSRTLILESAASESVKVNRLSDSDSGIVEVCLERPGTKNAIGRDMLRGLQHTLNALREDASANVLMICSAVPKVFCAGADLKERKAMTPSEIQLFVNSLRSTFGALEQLCIPSIAVIEGAALGGGLELALSCDFRICGEDAVLGLPETGLAIIPGAGGTQRLPRPLTSPYAPNRKTASFSGRARCKLYIEDPQLSFLRSKEREMAIPESDRNRPRARPPAPSHPTTNRAPVRPRVRLRRLLRVASVACGIQFGWALQLSLLTPYVQELGIPHAWASVIWLCGPLSGLLVQPLVGHMSDRCTSRFGRRRPFIVAGALSIAVAVLIIGHSADIGWLLGDRGTTRPRAIGAFVFGFWILDVANNMTQGPCRALLADLTGKDHRRTRVANAYFSLFMAVGNVLGFATGSFSGWYKIFSFTLTTACNADCANLKTAFFIDIAFIVLTTYISVSAAQELPLSSSERPANSADGGLGQSSDSQEAFMWELFGTFRYFSGPVWIILLVTALTWIGWFPFLLFDTDWMGREIYGGKPNEGQNYNIGVRMGALGLMLQSVVLGITSVLMEKLCSKWGAGFVWGISNVLMAISFLAMLIVTYVKRVDFKTSDFPPEGIVIAALVIFAILGIPLAITYSVPYALISSRIESLGLGQGLSMGVLNLAIVIPQVIVSLGSGPWDQLFGGGNSPAFVVAAVASLAAGLIAILAIPRSSAQKPRAII